MANIDNNKNTGNNKPLTEKVGEAVDQLKKAVTNPLDTAGNLAEQASKDVVSYTWWARLLLILFYTGLGLILLFFIAVNLPVTKRYVASQAIKILNSDFKAEMTTQSVDVNIFGDVIVRGLVIKDHKGNDFLKARQFRANSDWFSIIKNSSDIKFDALALLNADLKIVTYKGDSVDNFNIYIKKFQSDKQKKEGVFKMNTRVDIVDSKVSIINQNKPGDEGKWLLAHSLNARIPRLTVNGPAVNARVNNVNFRTTRWGKEHYIETFSTDLVYNNKLLSLKDLTINTDHSLLQGDVVIRQDRRTGWEDFANRVRMRLMLKRGSQLSGYDLSYFMPDWDKYEPINMSGDVSGVLNRFYLENFILSTKGVKAQTRILKLADLMRGRFHVETNQLSADFSYRSLKEMLPTFIEKRMGNMADVFGRINYNGALRATPGEIFARGNLITSIGQANAKVTLVGYSGNRPRYRGNAFVRDFNVAAITKRSEVGVVTGKIDFVGEGFDVNTMRLKTKANIQSIDLMQKNINNLYVDGTLDRRRFNGIINVNDEQARANVKGTIDFSSPRLLADIVADIKHLNLDYFGLKGQGNLSGHIDGTIAMTNLNDLVLDAKLAGLNFGSGKNIFSIPNAEVKAFMQNGERIVSVNAPGAINGRIAGRFNLGDLMGMVQNGLNEILVGNTPRRLYRGQSFAMDFEISQGGVNYFMPNLRIPRGAKVDGSYNGNSNDLVLNADVPELTYVMTKQVEITEADRALARANPAYKITENRTRRDSAMVSSLLVRINTADLDQQIFAKANRAQYNENVLKDVTLTGRNENNEVLHVSANFLHGTPAQEENDEMKAYAINLNQSVDSNRDIVIRFDPTEIKFNNVVWAIDTSPELKHSITYRKRTKDVLFDNLRVFSGTSAVLVNGSFRNAKDFDINADVQQVDISKVMALVSTENSMDIQGLADGNVKIRMKNNNLEPIIDLNVNGIKMNGQDMGDLVINAQNSSTPNVYDINARIVSAGIIGNNNLVLRGTINNNTSSPTLSLVADLNEFDLKFAQEFVKGIFSNMRGKATGQLNISGTLRDLDYNGDIALKGFGLKLNFSGVDYSFEDTVIPLSRGYAVLNNIGIKDGRNNSAGSISGAIQFETIASMGVNLIIRADNLMLLNSTQKDFDIFWGRVYGQGDIFIDGPVSALNISADARVLNNSIFTLNSNTTSTVEEFRMLRFLKEDTEGVVSVDERKITGPNMNVDLNLDVDRGTTVNVLVGDDIGDISVRGEATDLRFSMNRTGSMFINGSYFVDTGTFSSKAVLNRTFQIEKGSNIAWDGDALNPMLDITANYYRMVSNAGDYLDIGKIQPLNILLQIGITGTLTAPEIAFDVKAPDVSSQIRETLAYKMSTEDEKVLQFGSVLVMNSFNVANSGGLDFSLDNTIRSTGYSMLFKQLGSVLNSISNEFQIDLNYIQGDQGSNTGDRANAGVNITLSPRVTLKTGLGIPVSRRENTADDYVSTEGILEYDWSKRNDGSRLFRVYSKPTNIGMAIGSNAGTNQTYGAGVVYSKSFNTIFKRKKKAKSEQIENIEIKRDSVSNDSIKKQGLSRGL